jgi:hypothetical protein
MNYQMAHRLNYRHELKNEHGEGTTKQASENA